MNNLGFGLERLGIVALEKPRVVVVLAAIVTIVLAAFIPTVKFDGNITSVIPRTAQAFIDYQKQNTDFRNFSRDVAVIVRSPRLKTAEGLETLREMQIDLSIAEGVLAAYSMFSMPATNEDNGEIGRFFPDEFENDEQAREVLDRLLAAYPQAQSLFSKEEDAALILVALDIDADQGNNDATFDLFRTFAAEVEEVRPDDFEVLFAGLTPIGLTILDTLVRDQVQLTLLGLIAGAAIALAFFRCPGSAFLCGVPPTLTAIWSIGFFGMMDVPITYLTTILPTLALILAYADGIVLHHRWSRFNRERDKNFETYFANLKEAIIKVGPATALTSITTAFALSSFMLSSSEALKEFGMLGMVLVSFAFLSVIIVLPMLGIWFARMGWLRTSPPHHLARMVGATANRIYGRNFYVISVLGVLMLGFMFYSHYKLEPDYRITDYLPQQSDTREAERVANQVFGGRSMIFFSIPVQEEGGVASAANRSRIGDVSEILAKEFGDARVFSMHSYLKNFDQEAIDRLGQRMQDASDEVRQGYISRDNTRLLVSLRVPSSQSITESGALVSRIEGLLEPLDYSEEIVITGFPVLLAIEFTRTIEELRTNLLFAIAVGILLIGIATRSVFFALAASIPNIVPVLFVEMLIYVGVGRINITEVVALTLAFGIAIDNAVHIINGFTTKLKEGELGFDEALKTSVVEVAPALTGSMLILCAGTAVALTSVLPILSIIGKLIILILVVALLTNLILLPANIMSLGRLMGRSS